MDRNKMVALLNVAVGLTYAEWRLISQEIEHGFQLKLNRSNLEEAEIEKICARLDIELDAYFRQ